ncbi:MAG: PAS domain S-box protein [Candidatus Eisenbacteria bacterium]|nr:PAS domain S-box protein [Candidatus Eisenbacteria bacterium]
MNPSDHGNGPAFVAELLELLDEGVVLHDREGRVRAVNPAAERILGVAPFGLEGRAGLFTELDSVSEGGEPLAPDDEPAAQAVRSGLRCEPRRIRIRRRDGEIAWLLVKAVPLLEPVRDETSPRGAVCGALTVFKDTSDQVLIEQRLRGGSPEDSFGHLAGSVAHDFNHFLTVIVGYNDLILHQLPPGEPLREQAEHMRLAAKGATTLTRELMDFSRRQQRSAGVMDLPSTLTEMQPLLSRLLGPRILLRLELDRSSAWVRANPAQLERVVFNLALNARDAMRSGGELRLATRDVHIDDDFVRRHPGAQVGPFVRLTVSDSGVGMDEETRKRLFEPFFTTKPPGQGTGLGLASVWGIVKQFGGYIEVESEPGHGAEFRIDLPAATVVTTDARAHADRK